MPSPAAAANITVNARGAAFMSESTKFSIGSRVACSDGRCGELRRVVVDPVAGAITHLVVEPRHRSGMGHLVPVDLVASTGKKIRLRCSKSEFEALDDAEESRFLPGTSGEWDYEQDQMFSLPYYRLSMAAVGMGTGGMSLGGEGLGIGMGTVGSTAGPHAVTYDRVPVGEVEVRRGEHVHATDGPIGRVRGLVVDPRDHHVTHVLLDEGHLWGEKRVAIPISAVNSIDNGVRLSLTKDEVRDLPPVDVDHRD
jgi:sporulation protein YlmC with PRC-barrel domain